MRNLQPRTTSPVSSLREGSNPYRATHTHTHTHNHPPSSPLYLFSANRFPHRHQTFPENSVQGRREENARIDPVLGPSFRSGSENGIIQSAWDVTSRLFIPVENCLIYVSTFTFTLSVFISLYYYFGLICHLISTARLILLMCERNDPVEVVSDLYGIVPMILPSNHHLPLRTPPASSSYLLPVYPLHE